MGFSLIARAWPTLAAESVRPRESLCVRRIPIRGSLMNGPSHRVVELRLNEIVRLVMLLGTLLIALPLKAKVVVDFDPNLDYSKYKTYAFIGGVENLVSMLINPDLIDVRLHHSISQELNKRGLREVYPQENPDLVVRYWAIASAQVDVAVTGNWGPFGAYVDSYWGFLYNDVSTSSQKEGTLVIDVIDPKTKNLAWRLYLSRKFTDPDKIWKKVDEELAKAFDGYPPSDKAKEDKKKERAEHPPKSE